MLNIQTDTHPSQLKGESSYETVISTIFETWKNSHIDFVVLRNYTNLPTDPGNDLDILIDQHQIHQAETILINSMRSLGYHMYNRAEFACTSLYFINGSHHPLHIDLFTDFTWRGFHYFSDTMVLNNRESNALFSIPHPIHEGILNLLTRLLYHGYVPEKYKSFIKQSFQKESGLASTILGSYFGLTLANQLIEGILRENWTFIQSKTWALRLQLMIRQLIREPIVTIKNLLRYSVRLLNRFLRPPGLFIIFLGPDGSGKSTLAHRLIENLGSRFFVGPGSYVHWKSRLFFTSKTSNQDTCPNPHEAPIRSPLLSLVFFLYHWFEFAIGSLIKLRPLLFSNRMIIFDRYYHDFEVDQKRYRLQIPQAVIKLGKSFLRPPDMIFGLTASPEILQSRKSEVPITESIRQGEAYIQLVNSHKNGYVIEASAPLQEIEQKLQLLILEFLVKRTNSPS